MKWHRKYISDQFKRRPDGSYSDSSCVARVQYCTTINIDNGVGRVGSYYSISFRKYSKKDGREYLHRLDGPAQLFLDEKHKIYESHWYINNNEITEEVNEWIKENNYPDWQNWSDNIKTHFKMRFA